MWINLAVAASNLVALYWFPCVYPVISIGHGLYLCAMMASILMHLSETKHRLPGIWPLNLWSDGWLWLDVMIARLSAAYIAACVILNSVLTGIPSLFIWTVGIVGLVAVAIAEFSELPDRAFIMQLDFSVTATLRNYLRERVWIFAVTHILWHVCAFYVFASFLV